MDFPAWKEETFKGTVSDGGGVIPDGTQVGAPVKLIGQYSEEFDAVWQMLEVFAYMRRKMSLR